MNVLLVEDDDGVREVMADLLADSARVLAAQSLSEGLAALEKQPFELVIADLRLRGAGEGGRQMIAAARKHLTPVVIMTGLQGDEMKRSVGQTPPDAVLLKPFAIEDAMATCNRFFRLWRDVAGLVKAAPGATWEPFSAGLQVHIAEGDAQSGRRFLRVEAGTRSTRLSFPRSQGCQVREGQVSIDGLELAAGRPFFLSAGQAYELSSAQGGTLAMMSLPEPG